MDRSATREQMQASLNRLSRVGYGVVWTEALNQIGYSNAQIGERVRSGLLRRVASGTFVVSAVPRSWEQDLMIVCRRAPGRVWVAGEAAGALHGLDGCLPGRVVAVTTANVRRRSRSEHIKRAKAVPVADVAVLRGLPVTNVERTLLDLGDELPRDRVELAYECAIRRYLTTPARIKLRVDGSRRKGRRGPSVLASIIAIQEEGPPTGSALEVTFLQLNRRAGFPTPIRQRVFSDNQGRIIRVDFIYPGTDIVVEVDGRSFHLRRLKWEEDLERRNRLTARGLRVLHVTYRHMKGDPGGVIEEIAEALRLPVVGK